MDILLSVSGSLFGVGGLRSQGCGWGTWIRTKTGGVRVRCPTVRRSPIRGATIAGTSVLPTTLLPDTTPARHCVGGGRDVPAAIGTAAAGSALLFLECRRDRPLAAAEPASYIECFNAILSIKEKTMTCRLSIVEVVREIALPVRCHRGFDAPIFRCRSARSNCVIDLISRRFIAPEGHFFDAETHFFPVGSGTRPGPA
jgi:hypothetical protein